MFTELTESPERAADFILRGELSAFPTETVYGLGADACNPTAVARIFEAKGRPADNPLIVHISDPAHLRFVVSKLSSDAIRLLTAFMPGPLTLVLPRCKDIPDIVTAGLDTVGVRFPSHPIAQAFLKACGRPVAAPSANRSGRPSPTTWQAVVSELDGLIACVLKGEQSQVGLESTVVDCSGDVPVVLRAGAVTLEQLQREVPATRLLSKDSGPARSPGMKYRHYSPRAQVVLVDDLNAVSLVGRSAYIGLEATQLPFQRVALCRDLEDYARRLFEFFRECDSEAIEWIFCQRVEEKGLGLALMDRLRRASS